MMPTIAARMPALALWSTLQAGMWGFVWYRWSTGTELHTPLKSAIPAGHIGRGRYGDLPSLTGLAHAH
ncbi:hypothetical protein PHLGIDRAFT_19732 [Phlebiopsis gigantea 11061_1 CR5-6]|uniref:Uncharacterized protein n=1 Tax=Phlebiopsis gigantea (strain 11061_1 CR5-6) TaxID=745531 RepID=A0A0C3S534_PHLG1|nr:hypothetical protein PHLGIDRAFT_19732 [Phlebiopsis gigantea 11061_1 CR5-6]